MLVCTHDLPPVPEETAEVATAICPNGHPYLQIRDTFGAFFSDEDFADLYPPWGNPLWLRGGWRW